MYPQQPDEMLAALIEAARDRHVQLRILVADLTGRFGFLDDPARADIRAAGWSWPASRAQFRRHSAPG